MRIGRVIGALLTSWIFGLGGGLASLGELRYALAWLSALPVAALLAALVSPWAFLLLPLALAGSIAHAIAIAHRTEAPFRILYWKPWLMFAATILAGGFVRALMVESYKLPSSSMYPTLHIGDHVVVDKVTKLVRGWKRGDVIVHVYPCDRSRDYVKRIVGLGGDTIEVRCNVLYVNGKAADAKPVGGTCTYDDYDDFADRWYPKACSEYRESLDGSEWHTYHNEDRPEHERLWAAGTLATGDARDFPMREHPFPPSCADARDDFAPGMQSQVKGKLVETQPESARACDPQLHYVVPDDHVFVLGDNRNNSNDSRVWGSVPVSSIKGRVTGIWWSTHESGRIGSVH